MVDDWGAVYPARADGSTLRAVNPAARFGIRPIPPGNLTRDRGHPIMQRFGPVQSPACWWGAVSGWGVDTLRATANLDVCLHFPAR